MYSRDDSALEAEIVEHGALVTEHPLGPCPDVQNFPLRNRIMSGKTLGTLVVEAGDRSGALIASKHALNENKEVFTAPGNVLSTISRDRNRLVSGSVAKLVSDYRNVLAELSISFVDQHMEMAALFSDDDSEAEVLERISYESIYVDEIIRESGLEISRVSRALDMMELKELVKQVGGMNYIRLRETSAEYQAV